MEHLRLFLRECRLVRARRGEAGRLHDQPDLLDWQPAAALDVLGAHRSLRALGVEHGVEDRVPEPAAIERLARIVTEECRDGGRVVKGLGDGYMLAFSDVGAAVGTAWRIIERRRREPGPGIHASLHHGVAVVHDGDYFGTVVNVAARILAAARRDELLATSAVAQATDSEFEWQDAGANYVRGMTQTIDLCRLVGPREPEAV